MSNAVQINDQNTTINLQPSNVNVTIASEGGPFLEVVEQGTNTVTINIENVVAAPELAEYNVIVSSQEKPSLDVFEQVTSIITVNTPGPMGPKGDPGEGVDVTAFVTTSSFNAFTGSYNTGSFLGSLFGTASWANNAVTASYALNAVSALTSFISTGSVTASVGITPSSMFLISSASVPYFSITSSKGQTSFYSDLLIVNSFTTRQPVMTISESVVQFATHSSDPTGATTAGSIWFTSTALYLGLE